MGTGQTIMAVGALTLLSTLYISANSALQNNDQTILENGMALGALRCGQQIIERATRLKYDETLIGAAPVAMPAGFTAGDSLSLGPDAGETHLDLFDDLDDFNGYEGSYAVGAESFQIRVAVGYVDPDDATQMAEPVPGAIEAWGTRHSSNPTWVKRVEVTVSSPYLSNDLIMHHLFSYQP